MNLVGPGDLDEHYADCEQALAPLRAPAGRWVDLGSGAGFPGVLFAARHAGEGCTIELVDVRRKRCIFLEHVIARAGLGPPTVVVRNTEADALPEGAYDGVMARAFLPPGALVPCARRLLRIGGELVLFLVDQPVPEAPDFEIAWEHSYRLGERTRRSVCLRRVR